jgi:tetratricopeptide (TPR) repeat protein
MMLRLTDRVRATRSPLGPCALGGATLLVGLAFVPLRAASGQRATQDTAYAHAERLFWRADTLAQSGDRADVLIALELWQQAAMSYESGRHQADLSAVWTGIASAYAKLDQTDSALTYFARALDLTHHLRDREGEATILNSIGLVHTNRGQPDSALVYFTRALPIQRRLSDRAGEAGTLNNIGWVQAELGQPDSALAYYFKAFRIQLEIRNAEGQATALSNIGVLQANIGRPDSALSYYRRALSLRHKVVDRLGEATTLTNIGATYARLGRVDSALVYYSRAVPIQRDIGDRRGEEGTLSNIGAALANLGRPDSALAYFNRALTIAQEVGDAEGGATALNNIGLLQSNLGQPDSALASLAKALAIAHQIKARAREATSLNNIGLVQAETGHADSALAYYDRAVSLAHEVADPQGEAAALNNIGLLQSDLGRPDSAIVYYLRALFTARTIGDRNGEAASLNNIGMAQGDLGRPDSALAYYARALPIMHETGDRLGEGSALSNLGRAQASLGRPDLALPYYTRAWSIATEIGDRPGAGMALNNIGMAQLDLSRPDSALIYFARSLPILREVGDRASEAIVRSNIGLVHLRSSGASEHRAAVAMLDTAASIQSRVRHSAGGDANAVNLGEKGSGIFTTWSRAWRLLAEETIAAGDSAAHYRALNSSLIAAERGRAQALRDLLQRNRRRLSSGRFAVSDATLSANDTVPGVDLTVESRKLLASFRASRTAVLYYLFDTDTLWAWYLTPRGLLLAVAPLRRQRDSLAAIVAWARAALGADDAFARSGSGEGKSSAGLAEKARVSRSGILSAGVGTNATASAALAQLSDAVLPSGLDTLLPPGIEIVIVPHGALGKVPFAALTLPGDTIPLGVRNPLRYAPSLRALAEAEATVAPASRSALVVGNPAMPQVVDESGRLKTLTSLSGADSEGTWVANRLHTRKLSGPDASESAVRSLLPGAAIVHLATHGMAYGTEARVRDSYVALAPGDGQDGLLTLGELLDDPALRISADLVVLSACQTGLGESRDAEGTVGLQRGLLAKGARSVLVSLWSVNDEATRVLMEHFYTHWLDDQQRPQMSKAEALRLAEAEIRSDPEHPAWRQPKFWAAFQLVGAR